ncbi:MAG: GTPase Era, partial [Acidobacteria bacterium]
VKKSETPALLLLNKIDLLRSEKLKLLPLIERFSKLQLFREIIPISARKREGLDVLLKKLANSLPAGPHYFTEEQITDQPVRFMAAELIREQVLLQTAEEVPHQTTVVIEQFEEKPKLVRIAAVIYCEREGQKRILIGRQGQMLKQIGTEARLEIERMLGVKVFLELFIKVRANWRDWRKQLQHLVAVRPE